MSTQQWFLLETDKDYQKAIKRFEEIRNVPKKSMTHKEKILLAFLINQYEQKLWDIPALDPVELIKIRMEDFGFKPVDLAKEYGDKGTISKVLNYKQPLSLSMIRKFSKMLRLPSDALMKEYKTA
ncbi:MAG: hypothetical protein WAT19_03450 [Ferruginibacter sp.]